MVSIRAAFHEIWETLEAQHAVRVGPDEDELKGAIIRRLLDLVGDGTTSQEELKVKVLGSLSLG